MGTENRTVLDRFFDEFKRGDSLLILTHDNPDPDSMSSACALAEIARVLGEAKVVVAYGGIIGRAENAHMVSYLKLKLKPLDKVNVSKFSKVALIDTQPRTGNNSLPSKVIPDLVIDHHAMIAPTRKVPFVEIRTNYGATASILSEYLQHFGLEISKNLATALLYGIKSETQDLAREAYQVDVDQYIHLLPLANHKILSKIIHSRVPRNYFRWLLSAIQNAQVVDNVILIKVGAVDSPDVISETADLMLRMRGAAWTLVQGVYRESVYLSIRSTNIRKNAGILMKRLMKGRGTGGGHGLIAGGKMPVKGMEAWQVHDLGNEVEDHFLKLIRKSDKPKSPLLEEDEERKAKNASLVAVGGKHG